MNPSVLPRTRDESRSTWAVPTTNVVPRRRSLGGSSGPQPARPGPPTTPGREPPGTYPDLGAGTGRAPTVGPPCPPTSRGNTRTLGARTPPSCPAYQSQAGTPGSWCGAQRGRVEVGWALRSPALQHRYSLSVRVLHPAWDFSVPVGEVQDPRGQSTRPLRTSDTPVTQDDAPPEDDTPPGPGISSRVVL